MNTRRLRLRLVHLGLAALLALLLSGMASAAPPQPDQPADPVSPAGLDDGTLDVGAEYPSADAPPWGAGGSDLPYTADSATHFYNKMRAAGYTGPHSFIFGNASAWETDWKRAALGGAEDNWVDNVDIMFFHDHGGNSYMWFPWGHTDDNLAPNDCLGSWGTKDVEWIGIKSCLTLIDRGGWANCMNGVHLIAGMITISYGADYGGDWADQLLGSSVYIWPFGDIWLRAPKTVTQAWFTACDANQPSSVTARVIAEDWRHFNDKVWNRGGPAYGDVVDNTYFWQDHACYKPPARQIDADAVAAAPVQTYVVNQRQVDETYVQGVLGALGLQGATAQLSADGSEWGLTASMGGQTMTLSIDTASGGYVVQNVSQLFTGQDPTAPLTLPSADAAVPLAGRYLDGHQALPGSNNIDKNSAQYLVDSQAYVAKPVTVYGAAVQETILQQQGTDAMVAYGRTLPTGVLAANGAMIAASTVGPGSVTKLYYGGASQAMRAENQDQLPIGLIGGNRTVGTGGLISTSTYTKTWDDFVLDPQLAVIPVPLDWDRAERLGQTFSYYEQPHGVSQQELMPVWVFTANFFKGNVPVGANTTVYVPASSDYYPPNVTIDAPLAGATVVAGRLMDFMSTAAGGYGPFKFEWSASPQGALGNKEDVKSSVLAGVARPGEASEATVSLKVTNANGQSRTVEVVVTVVGSPTWLPMLSR